MMLDLHCHILPHVDDGAADLGEALDMVRLLGQVGFTGAAASPHHGGGPGGDVAEVEAKQARDQLCAALKAEGSSFDVLPNAEHYLGVELMQRMAAGELITIGGKSKWLLLELPWGAVVDVEAVLFRVQTRGYRVLLAHPERSMSLDLEVIERMVTRGVRMQAEIGSFVGVYGDEERQRARSMLQCGLVHVLATDLHSVGTAEKWLTQAFSWLGDGAAELGAGVNPKAIVADASADDIEPIVRG
ncbi:MAG: hypothetical protein A2289_10850 [Deltaproteobacteria bacterium RIFOXYA12_FULL_58_15]|nr:MAG: hypothetical protein A2289_10850 [Deltaproteobacteria bacterium RIFOXYA12_FULL_58_15]OGR09935.1 MAG: hypothetical protein A2341_27450 [Deltaproteobacteria bacterium RIFOXYB12_FULL_58_9]